MHWLPAIQQPASAAWQDPPIGMAESHSAQLLAVEEVILQNIPSAQQFPLSALLSQEASTMFEQLLKTSAGPEGTVNWLDMHFVCEQLASSHW